MFSVEWMKTRHMCVLKGKDIGGSVYVDIEEPGGFLVPLPSEANQIF